MCAGGIVFLLILYMKKAVRKTGNAFERFTKEMIQRYGVTKADIELAIAQFGYVKSRIRHYCQIAAGIREGTVF